MLGVTIVKIKVERMASSSFGCGHFQHMMAVIDTYQLGRPHAPRLGNYSRGVIYMYVSNVGMLRYSSPTYYFPTEDNIEILDGSVSCYLWFW